MANKLYEEESIKAIADAIRLRKDASNNLYTVGEMNDAVTLFPYNNIPRAHYIEASKVIYNILKFKETHPNHLIFGIGSDFHIAIGTEKEELSKTSNRHAEFALDIIGKIADIDFLVYGGDYSWNTYIGDETLYALTALNTENHIPKYYLVGNHDKTQGEQSSQNGEIIYNLIGSKNNFTNHGITQERSYGYTDYAEKKVRLICLNTCDYFNTSGGHGMSYEQKAWLMSALDLSKKEEEGWQILILSHIPIDFSGGNYNIFNDLKSIFDAYTKGTSVQIETNFSNETQENCENYPNYSNGKLVYDYANKNSAKIIANIHGHVHNNVHKKIQGSNILRMSTPNTCYYLNAENKYPNAGDYEITNEEALKLIKVENSEKDTALTFFCIDLNKQAIYAYGYGANTDYVETYGEELKSYTVSYDLFQCNYSNSDLLVYDGDSYSTIILPNPEYCLTNNEITITMGEIDITSEVITLEDGYIYINIPSVSNNINISIAASIDYTQYSPAWDIANRDEFITSSTIDYKNINLDRFTTYIGSSWGKDYAYVNANKITNLDDPSAATPYYVINDDHSIQMESNTNNTGIGLSIPVNAGDTFRLSGNVKLNKNFASGDDLGRFFIDAFDRYNNRISYNNPKVGAGSEVDSTNFELTFIAPENAKWIVITPIIKTVGDNVTYSNLILTKTN